MPTIIRLRLHGEVAEARTGPDRQPGLFRQGGELGAARRARSRIVRLLTLYGARAVRDHDALLKGASGVSARFTILQR